VKLLIKILILNIVLIALFSGSVCLCNVTLAEQSYFAHITTSDVFFYSSPTNADEAKLFLLPESYFVEIYSNANDDFYSAKYLDVYGYVLKESVRPVITAPTMPYLTNINFRVFVPSGANLRSSPFDNGSLNLIYSIPFLDSNISYYGTMLGEESISKKGNVWYYCKYFSSNVEYIGYVYAPLCDCLSPISKNTEVVEYLESPPNFDGDNNVPTQTEPFAGLSSTTTTIIIIAVSLPCLLFIYLLFKPTKIAEQQASRKKGKSKKFSRLKRSDYYELDDDF